MVLLPNIRARSYADECYIWSVNARRCDDRCCYEQARRNSDHMFGAYSPDCSRPLHETKGSLTSWVTIALYLTLVPDSRERNRQIADAT